jgi:hypothetical protein
LASGDGAFLSGVDHFICPGTNYAHRTSQSGRHHPLQPKPAANEPAVDAVAGSIAEFGWRQPIVVDQRNVIVVGRARYKAAQKLGLKAVPVHVATDLTPAQVRAYRIADNKLAELAAWDLDLLPGELAALDAAEFDLELLGFSEHELARVLLPGRSFYIWGGYANCANYPPVLEAAGLYFSQSIIWHRQHPVLTRKDFMGDHE